MGISFGGWGGGGWGGGGGGWVGGGGWWWWGGGGGGQWLSFTFGNSYVMHQCLNYHMVLISSSKPFKPWIALVRMPTRWQAIIWTNDGQFTHTYICHSASMSSCWSSVQAQVYYDVILHVAWYWQMHDKNQTLNSEKKQLLLLDEWWSGLY